MTKPKFGLNLFYLRDFLKSFTFLYFVYGLSLTEYSGNGRLSLKKCNYIFTLINNFRRMKSFTDLATSPTDIKKLHNYLGIVASKSTIEENEYDMQEKKDKTLAYKESILNFYFYAYLTSSLKRILLFWVLLLQY